MEIKEYADRIREEIKKELAKFDELRGNMHSMDYDHYNVEASKIIGKVDGLNKALDIYLELVKGDL